MRGAHGRQGPAPDPNALRRDRDGADWLTLPAEGRDGDPPAWPLPRPSKRDLELWRDLWARPQAVMWEANGQGLEVAMYVRSLRDAEKAGAPSAARVLVIRQQEALGLSIPGLNRNRWRIGTVLKPPAAGAGTASAASLRDRLRLVPDGGV